MSNRTASPGSDPPFGPDAIWAPWRLPYLESLSGSENPPGAVDPRASDRAPDRAPDGFLSAYWKTPERDREHHVIVRDGFGMILLNRYPYANGHLLVALGEPRPELLDYDADERAALWRLVDRAMGLMRRVLEPQGVNIGVNQGRAAGAGVPGHLHVHLVPRWGGDTNFMTTAGQIRVIPASLDAVYQKYVLAQ